MSTLFSSAGSNTMSKILRKFDSQHSQELQTEQLYRPKKRAKQ
jgi:hypothetical protein